MELEAKRQLIDELDRSLLAHAAALGQKDGGPSIADAYGLQGLAELHYYLKVEHEFTAAEVDALLQFADPLEVAQSCWEENAHKHSFPICEILKEIDAYQQFPQKAPLSEAQRQEQLVDEVKAVLDHEMAMYKNSLLSMGKVELIYKSGEITAMKGAYDFMRNEYKFEKGDAEILLQMNDPLKFAASLWPTDITELFDMLDLVGEAIEEAGISQQEAAAVVQEPAPLEKPSVRGQLRAAIQEANQRPAQENKTHGGDAR